MLLLLCMGTLVSGRRHSRRGRCGRSSFLACSSSNHYHQDKNLPATDGGRAKEIVTGIRPDIFDPESIQDFVRNYQEKYRAAGHGDWLNMRLRDGIRDELDCTSHEAAGKVKSVKRVLEDSLPYSIGVKKVQWKVFKVPDESRQGLNPGGMAQHWKDLGQDPSAPYQTHLRRIERIAMTLCHAPYPGVKEWLRESDTYESRFFDIIVAIYLSVWRTGKVKDADTVEGLTYELMNTVIMMWDIRDSGLAHALEPKVIGAMTNYVFGYFGGGVCEPNPRELRAIKRFVGGPVDIPINLRLVKHTFRHASNMFLFRLYQYIYVCGARLGEKPCSTVSGGVYSPPTEKELLSTLAKMERHFEGWWHRIYLRHLQ